MRTDCKRDNKRTQLPNASWLGYDKGYAKRGDYVQYEDNGRLYSGRILSFVTATSGADNGTRYIEVAALLGNIDCIGIRWIDPASVVRCTDKSPLQELQMLCGDIGALDDYAKRNA